MVDMVTPGNGKDDGRDRATGGHPRAEQPASETHRVARAAGTVGAWTLASRVLGFIRDMVVARLFGASVVADAFFVAFRIPNMLRELLAEGTMSAAFIPVFTEKLTTGSRKEAWELASRVFTMLLVLLVTVTCVGILAAPLIVDLMAPGFSDATGQRDLTVLLTRIMFPYLLLVGLSALAMGMLNAVRAFALPAMAPMCFNLMVIGSAVWLAPYTAEPALALAVGVLLGGVAQLGIQLPGLARAGLVPRLNWAPKDPQLRRVGRLMIPVVFGLSVTQVNLLVNTLLASYLDPGSVSYLYYGMRLIHFPLGIFGIALATAILPSLSAQAARNDLTGVATGLTSGLRLILFITLPAMAGLMALRVPIVSTLFERGAFDAAATAGVATAVLAYACGLWAFAAVRVVASTFYALKDTATPVRAAAVAMVVNILLNLALMGPLAHGGLALATALSAMVNVGLLLWFIGRRVPQVGLYRVVPSALRSCAAAMLMGGACYWIAEHPIWERVGSVQSAGLLALIIPLAAGIYLLLHRGFGGTETGLLFNALRRRGGRNTGGDATG